MAASSPAHPVNMHIQAHLRYDVSLSFVVLATYFQQDTTRSQKTLPYNVKGIGEVDIRSWSSYC
eukprot:5385-Eustigmatos_ZCMA.PRE.1